MLDVKYVIILMEDDNSVYKVYGYKNKMSFMEYVSSFTENWGCICACNIDNFNYSDNVVIKRARKKQMIIL